MSDFTLFIVGPAVESEGSQEATLPGSTDQLHSLSRCFASASNEVPAVKLLESFEKTQVAIKAMLAKVGAQDYRGFRLEEFDVSLAASREGTIGIVTASAQAGVVLKFKRKT